MVRILRPALEQLAIEVEVCNGIGSGQEILRTEKFDAILVDCDDLDGGIGVLASLRKAASNKNSVTFAILNGSTTTQQAFRMGANFVLQKPISALNAKRCLGAAINFMIREQRRYFRHPVELAATLDLVKEEAKSDPDQYQRRRHGHLFPRQVAARQPLLGEFQVTRCRYPSGTESASCLDG